MIFYAIKYWLIRPRVWIQRLYHRDLDHAQRMIYEAYNYAPAFKQLYKNIQEHDLLNDHDLSEQSIVVVVGGSTSTEWINDLRKRYGCRFFVYPDTTDTAKKLQFFYSQVDEVYIRPGPVEILILLELIDLIDRDKIDLIRFDAGGEEYPLLPLLVKACIHKRFYQILIQFNENYFMSHLRRYFITRSLKHSHRRVWNYPFICEKWVWKEDPSADKQGNCSPAPD